MAEHRSIIMNAPLFLFLFFVLQKNFGATLKISHSGSSVDKPLFLTSYIESGDIATGRALSRVGRLPNAPRDVPSYSGYFTVNKEYNSNLFFWFFPAENNDVKSPLLLWLQGGPGASGLLGLFAENGPYALKSNTTACLRKHRWTKEYHMLYVDSPVGTGFSFADNDKGYSNNQDEVADNLYIFLKQFFQVFPEYGGCDFYLTGESYGGKHIPYLGHKLHVDGTPSNITFKGFAVGNPFITARQWRGYHDFLYQQGYVDEKQAAIIKQIFDAMEDHLNKGENFLAVKEFNKYVDFFKDPDIDTEPLINKFTGFKFLYNLLTEEEPKDYRYHETYIKSPEARKAIHVGNHTFGGGDKVKHYLKIDLVVSSSLDKIGVLADNYRVLVYAGQLDLVIPYVFAENLLLNNLTWSHADEFRQEGSKVWKVDDYTAGYVRNYGNLYLVAVRNSGHLVPHDQPKVALDLINKFIRESPYA